MRKGLRNAFLDSSDPAEQDAKVAALAAYETAALSLEEEQAAQGTCLAKAVLTRPKPTNTDADEKKWDVNYNARRDKLSTAWRKLWVATHGVMVARRIYESVALHRLDRRALVPGEREVPVEVEFRPEPEQDLLLACLWRYVEPEGDEPGFYTVAAITGAPLPDFTAAGHDRSVIAITPDTWTVGSIRRPAAWQQWWPFWMIPQR